MADSSNPRLDAARRYADDRLTQAIREAGVTEEDEAYAWGGFHVGPDSFAGRLRIRAVAGFPHEGQLDAPTMEEMTDCGMSEEDARAYIDEWSLDDATRSLETSLFMSAACIAGARAIEARAVERPAVERLVAALRYQLDAWGERVVRQKDPKYAEAEALLAEFGEQPTGDEQ